MANPDVTPPNVAWQKNPQFYAWMYRVYKKLQTLFTNKITADSVTLSAGTSSSTVSDLQTSNDGNVYQLDEASATPGFTLIIDFIDVKFFNFVQLQCQYEGTATHAAEVELYHWVDDDWDHFDALHSGESNTGTIFENHTFLVPNDAQFIGTGDNAGKVRVRINHPMNGNASHDLYIDVVALYQ